MQTAGETKIKGYPARKMLACGFRLRSSNAFQRKVRSPGSNDPWLNPYLFEKLCDHSTELQEAAQRAVSLEQDKLAVLEEKLQKLFTSEYLSRIIRRFNKLLPDLAKYFAAKADYGGLFDEDREAFKQLQTKFNLVPGVTETSNVDQL